MVIASYREINDEWKKMKKMRMSSFLLSRLEKMTQKSNDSSKSNVCFFRTTNCCSVGKKL